ncbi:MAG: hypothetical protein ACXWVJ_09070 [Caulobacteraceae bacterium]
MDARLAEDRVLTPSVATTLEVLAAELEIAGARCITLDRVMGEVMAALPEADRVRMLSGLHDVDLLGQHLTNLSAFSRGLSDSLPSHLTACVAGAISSLTLGALADRMVAGLGGGPAAARDASDGDLDLF